MQQPAIPIAQIIVDPTLQPRVEGIDPDQVQSLEAVSEHWPPLKVAKRGNRFILLDGFHRLAAAQNLKLATVQVTVVEATEEQDLRDIAFGLNAVHGSPLSLTDRRAHAAWLLRKNPNSSDREIGRRCGLTQPTVAKVRQELEQQAQIEPAEKRVGRDGRTYNASQKSGTTSLAAVVENLIDAFSPAERRAQRQFVNYLKRLASVLDEQHGFEAYENFETAANACRVVLGGDGANEFAQYIGPESWNILQIARALGYREDAQ